MHFLRYEDSEPAAQASAFLSDWSIRKKLLVTMIPAVVCILVVTGYASHLLFTHYFSIALERNAIVLTMAQAHEIESLFATCRNELSILATKHLDKASLAEFLKSRNTVYGGRYREVVFAGVDPREQIYLLCNQGELVDIPVESAALMKNSPLIIPKRAGEMQPGDVLPSGPIDLFFPPTVSLPGVGNLSLSVFRFFTPVVNPDGALRGYLVLSLDAHVARNILSLFTSPKSPLYGFPRAAENRYSFYFDDKGWMLFQSENADEQDKELSVELARSGFTGDQGRTGFEAGFRPSPQHQEYWRMMEEVRAGRSGLGSAFAAFFNSKSVASEQFLGFAPVRFPVKTDEPGEVIGGIIYVDRSLLPRAAEFGQFNVMFGIGVASMLAVSLLIYFLSRIITRPILRLATEVTAMHDEGRLRRMELPESDYETSVLKRSINDLIASLTAKDQEIRRKEEYLRTVQSRETVRLDGGALLGKAGDILGSSPPITALLSLISKTAAADADVLVVGETGTGKELTAEAIHKQSARSGKPFISINCGALDENLLMDAIFGHVKGAFSEAKSDRKGAFLAADGGTLHLDEIGNASVKVQQSLLRALSVRRIRPLGSDTEIDFDARVIAATNVNLKEKVQKGEFREDLYYRLQVLTISTPPLRERMEDIPILAGHFLRQAAGFTGKGEAHLSRGALEKLMRHDWPGNVRELKNCLTRAVALAEREVIYAEDIKFGDECPRLLPDDVEESAAPGFFAADAPTDGHDAFPEAISDSPPREAVTPPPAAPPRNPDSTPAPTSGGRLAEQGLNPRQRKALAGLGHLAAISRQDYQDAAGSDVPDRTAQHDLKELVEKGFLHKSGRGPSTRYHLAKGRTDLA